MSDQYSNLLPDSLIPVWATYVQYEFLIDSWMVGPKPLNSGPDCFSNDGSPYFCFQLLKDVPYSRPDVDVHFICFREIVKVETYSHGKYHHENWMRHKKVVEYLDQLPKPIEHFIGNEE